MINRLNRINRIQFIVLLLIFILISIESDQNEIIIENNDNYQCNRVKREYLPSNLTNYMPALLYSFPGSGNTWCRLLLDYATGIYSGSFFHDSKLFDSLPGEEKCDKTVSIIKAHPHLQPYYNISLFNQSNIHYSDDIVDKCHMNGLNNFTRAILLVRNPYDAFWSEFQRRGSKSHILGRLKAETSITRINYNKRTLPIKYIQMWERDYKAFMIHGETLLVKYEDLRNNSVRIKELNKMIEFLRLPPNYYSNLQKTEKIRKLQCAFKLSEKPSIHRMNITIIRNESLYIQKDEFFTYETVCEMWKVLRNHSEPLGYKPYRNYNCDTYNKTAAYVE